MVFLGTVTDALTTENGRMMRARMRIDRAYKGVSEKTLILVDHSACAGPNLQLGEQYLMYSNRYENGDAMSSTCMRSRHAQDAEQDLKYLDGLSEAAPTGTVFGQVALLSDFREGDQPGSGAMVRIRGQEETLTTAADGEGHYSFEGLKPANYSVGAIQPGFRMLSLKGEGVSARVEARGCAVVNVLLRKQWPGTIEGRLTRSDGTSAPAGIDLGLIRVEVREEDELSSPLFTEDLQTNDHGEYSFRGVAPGRYKVVMHRCCFPTPEVPYPAIYWPTASTEAGAAEIEIGDAAVLQKYDFRLPAEVKGTAVRGILLLPDGKPAGGARVQVLKMPENGITGEDLIADAVGHFSFTAMEGLEYSLTATSAGERRLSSETLIFSLGKGPQSVTLVLDAPRAFENPR